jgi:UDP-N-acetylmuramoylalanine--D-glutamate ligase
MESAQGRFANERVVVLGMARSGFAAARLLIKEGARPLCLDLRRPADSESALADLERGGASFAWGPHDSSLLQGIERIIKSPGVRSEIDFLEQARARGIPIWSEIELAARCARGQILGVTGTNGKSTTTAWTADMLRRCGRDCELVGNIGRPISEGVLQASEDAVLVTEISSFQLEEVETFRPKGAALLNLTADHLDRHGDFDAYKEAKMRIFQNQTDEDHAVLGEQNEIADEVARRFSPRLLRFRLEDHGEEGAAIRGSTILTRHRGTETVLAKADELSLPGFHNLANALASLALLAPFRLPMDGLLDSLRGFAGLPHRLERIVESEAVLYVNDSKATNAESMMTALVAYTAPLILLAGGRGKGQDFTGSARLVRERCRKVILFGEAAREIAAAWGEDLCEVVEDLAEALRGAHRDARAGEIVLLSPACASFDQFRDYEERGDRFRGLVRELTGVKEGR